MNKIFRVIWNHSTQTWTAVSELAKGRVKASSQSNSEKGGLFKLTALSLALLSANVFAATSLGGGTATEPSGGSMVVNYHTPNNTTPPDGSNSGNNYGNSGAQGVAIGSGAQSRNGSVVIGGNASANDNNQKGALAVAIGGWASARNTGSVALGSAAAANALNALAIQRQAAASGDYSMAIGTAASVTGDRAIGIGKSVLSSGARSIAIGSDNTTGASNNYNSAENTQATGTDSIALGGKARATANNAMALGAKTSATHADSVALGAGSETGATAKQLSYEFKDDTGAKVDPKDQANQNSVLSVGNGTHKRQIINVAQGRITEDSTDAVNGSQLYDVVTKTGFNVAGNAGTAVARINNNGIVKFLNSDDGDDLVESKVENDGDDAKVRFNIKTKQITSSQGSATATGAGLAKSSEVVAAINNSGFNLLANGVDSSFIANGGSVDFAQGKNIVVTKSNNKITIATDDNPTFSTLKTTGAATIGGTLTVADATAANHAVTKQQLDAAVANAGGSWQLGANDQTSLGTVNKTNNVMRIKEGSNVNVTRNNNDITVKLVDAPSFAGKVTAAGFEAGNKQITGVADGSVAAGSKDAVNGGQLFEVKNAAKTAQDTLDKGLSFTADSGTATNQKLGTTLAIKGGNGNKNYSTTNVKTEVSKNTVTIKIADNPEFTSVNTGDLTATGQTNLKNTKVDGTLEVTGGTTFKSNVNMSNNKITGLADAQGASDAVNKGQLDKAVADALNNASGNWFLGINDQDKAAASKVNKDADLVLIKQGSNIVVTRTGNNVSIATSDTPTFSSVNTGDLTATGTTSLETLNVNGTTTLKETTIDGPLTVNGTTTLKNTLDMSNNKITNVKSGDISANSKDAVNGGDVYNAIDEAKKALTDKGLTFNGDTGTTTQKLGTTLSIVGGNGTGSFSTANVRTDATENTVTIKISDNPTFSSLETKGDLKVGGNQTVAGDSTISGNQTVKGDLSVEGDTKLKNTTVDGTFEVTGATTLKETTINGTLDMAGNKITGVANATADSDAVNKGQVDKWITDAKDTLTNTGLTFNGDKGSTTQKLGTTLSIVGGNGTGSFSTTNVRTDATTDTVTIKISDNPTFSSLETTGNLTVGGSQTVVGDSIIKGSQTIDGDLTVVNGSTTLKDTTINGTLDMAGNKITGVANGTIAQGSTDAVNGGDLFNEVKKLTEKGLVFVGNNPDVKVQRNLGTTLQIVGAGTLEDDQYSAINVKTVGNLADGIEIRIANNPTFSSLETKGDIKVGGNQTVVGDSTIKGSQTIEKDLTVNGDANIKGNQTVAGDSTIKGSQTIEKDLTVNGDANIKGNQTVAGDSTIKGSQTIEKDLTVNGDANIKGNQTVAGDSTIKGSQTIEKDLTVNGDANIKGNQTVAGDSTIKGSQTIEKDLTVNGDANIKGNQTVAGDSTIKGSQTIEKDLTVKGNANINGNQTVAGDSTIQGNQTIEKDLTVNGATNLKGDTTVGGEGKTFEVVKGTTINMGGNTVTNIGKGSAPTDAANMENVKEAMDALEGKGLNFHGDNADVVVARKLGQTLAITAGNGTGAYSTKNVKTVGSEGKIEIQIADNPTFSSLETTGDVTVGGNSHVKGNQTVDGNQIVKKDLTVEGKANIKGDTVIGGNQTVKGDSKIGGNQTVEKDLTVKGNANIKGNSKVGGNQTVEKNLTVKGDTNLKNTVVNGDFSAKGNTQIGGQGKNFEVVKGTNVNMGGNRIQNVGAPIKATDAANRGYVDNKIKEVGNKMHKLDRNLRAGIAGASAMAFIQRPHEAGKSMVSMAVGGYKGESAVAVGYARNSDNNRVSIKLGVGVNSRSDVTYGGSVGYQW